MMHRSKLNGLVIALFLYTLRLCSAFAPLLHSNNHKTVAAEETGHRPTTSIVTKNCHRAVTKMSLLENLKGSSAKTTPIEVKKIELSGSGTVAQVTTSIPKGSDDKPPLLFIHGSFHADWCWTEHYFPYFTSLGYACIAYCLRGTGGTPAEEGVKKTKIMDHVEDLEGILEYISKNKEIGGLGMKSPVMVAHSFGGPLVMKYLEKNPAAATDFSGVAILCSVPPSGIQPLVMRGLFTRSLRDNWKITAGMAMKQCTTNPSNARALFFGGDPIQKEDGTTDDFGISDDLLERYQGNFQRDAVAVIDVVDLGRKLPSKCTDKDGVAPFASDLPPVLVVGGKNDFIVDGKGNEETAKFFGVDEVTVIDSPHDVMLGKTWQNGADAIVSWLRQTVQ